MPQVATPARFLWMKLFLCKGYYTQISWITPEGGKYEPPASIILMPKVNIPRTPPP